MERAAGKLRSGWGTTRDCLNLGITLCTPEIAIRLNHNADKFLLVAVDDGPRATLATLAALDDFYFPEIHSDEVLEQAYWTDLIAQFGCRAMIAGTSDSDRGRAIESAARRAASRVGKKVVLVEDYPGNYYPVDGARTDLLVVDSEFSGRLNREKFTSGCPSQFVCPPFRYDPYRVRAVELRAGIRWHWLNEKAGVLNVLWAGQPETDDALATLERVCPLLRQHGVGLLFRAHPRDRGYADGRYQRFFLESGIHVTDVTSLSLDDCMAMGPRLVATQFSSMAIEAGFYGIPSVHFLYPDIGGKRLLAKKGFTVTPWCAAGASILIDEPLDQKEMFTSALFDESVRRNTMARFDTYFHTDGPVTPIFVNYLYNFALSEFGQCGQTPH
jgi:hypothetical protein